MHVNEIVGYIEVRSFCLVKHFIAVEIFFQQFVIDLPLVQRLELFPVSSKRLSLNYAVVPVGNR